MFWEDIVKIIAATANFFQLPLPNPQGMYGECLDFYEQHDKLVINLGPDFYLVFSMHGMLKKINVYLVCAANITTKRDWEKSLREFQDNFYPSYLGGDFTPGDPCVDLTGERTASDSEEVDDVASEEDLQGYNNDDHHGGLPKNSKTYFCPNCAKQLVDDNGQLYCEECEEYRFVCPHCQEVQLEVPEDNYGKCEDCGKSFYKIECPKCSTKILPDEIECPHCHEEFELNECPHCSGDLIKGINPDCCPYCGEDIYPCPRCGEHFESDPVDENNYCSECEQAYAKIKCPQCKEEIYADEATCPHCNQKLETDECPDCSRVLVVSDKLDECPFCDITLYICPRCHQYISEDPDDIDECPYCEETLKKHTCDKCGEEIPVDSEICPHCGEEISLEDCPYCEKKIPCGLDECPYCEASLEITQCPHCSKTHYVN